MPTFADVLSSRLRADAGQPLVTFYDHATGERTELSVATYANWVAKAASYLVEECDLERGDTISIRLPAHWLTPVFLGAAWTAGLVVVWDGDADALVVGPDDLERAAAEPARARVATALHPLGQRFTTPLPAGIRDFGAEVWSQPDSYLPYDPPGEGDEAVAGTTHGELWSSAAAGSLVGGLGDGISDGDRLFTEVSPASPSGLASLAEPLARAGSVVWVRHLDPARAEATYAAERATRRWP